MPYTIDVFTNWPGFATWEDLRTWLQSPEGGLLRVVEPPNSEFAIVRYTKGQSDFALPHVRWCRSVVVNKTTRLPCSVAPPKGAALTDAVLVDCAAATAAEEFMDGTMLNLALPSADPGTEVLMSTRSRLGGKQRFFEGGPSFAEMFLEAAKANGVEACAQLLPQIAGQSSAFTSVVVQHPQNRIVSPVEKPALLIVHQGTVAADGKVTIEENPAAFRCDVARTAEADWNMEPPWFKIPSTPVAKLQEARNVETWLSQQSQQRGYGWQGIVLKDSRGGRFRLRSQVYETVRRIRGNESSVEERFARLRGSRGTEQYLAFFPEDRETFFTLEGRLRANTRRLSDYYTSVFRARSLPYHELPWPYKHHVSVLHNLYKDTMRATGTKMDLNEVIRYVNGLAQEDLANMTKKHTLLVVKKSAAAAAVVEASTATA